MKQYQFNMNNNMRRYHYANCDRGLILHAIQCQNRARQKKRNYIGLVLSKDNMQNMPDMHLPSLTKGRKHFFSKNHFLADQSGLSLRVKSKINATELKANQDSLKDTLKLLSTTLSIRYDSNTESEKYLNLFKACGVRKSSDRVFQKTIKKFDSPEFFQITRISASPIAATQSKLVLLPTGMQISPPKPSQVQSIPTSPSHKKLINLIKEAPNTVEKIREKPLDCHIFEDLVGEELEEDCISIPEKPPECKIKQKNVTRIEEISRSSPKRAIISECRIKQNRERRPLLKEVSSIHRLKPTRNGVPERCRPGLQNMAPINLEQEEKKFFESQCRICPVFSYEKANKIQQLLSSFAKPDKTLLPLAQKILDEFIAYYGSESVYLEKFGGEILSQTETLNIFQDYINQLGLEGYIKLQFSPNTVSPTCIAHDPNSLHSVITIGLPIEYRRHQILGVLHHEIGTHFLRKYNDAEQVWHGERSKYSLRKYTATEEGLASINQLYNSPSKLKFQKPYLFKPALYYYACCMAEELNFSELFNDLEKYVDHTKRRFRICLRAKRGLEDTNSKGGLYKDKVYFEGAVKILQKRKEINFFHLFAGKIALDDIARPEIQRRIKTDSILLPPFFGDKYAVFLDRIASSNFL